MRTITAEDLERDPDAARDAANGGPVIVTEGGRKAYVILSWDDYVAVRARYEKADGA